MSPHLKPGVALEWACVVSERSIVPMLILPEKFSARLAGKRAKVSP